MSTTRRTSLVFPSGRCDRVARAMLRSVPGAIAVAALLLGTGAAQAASIRVPQRIEYARGSNVRPAIQDECGIQTVIPEAIARSASNVELVSGKKSDLELTITDAHGPGGGVFSGPKWVEVTGKLRRGSKVVGSFRAKRVSTTDIFSGGTCGILAKCARKVGADIGAWLQNPTMDAKLGDAR